MTYIGGLKKRCKQGSTSHSLALGLSLQTETPSVSYLSPTVYHRSIGHSFITPGPFSDRNSLLPVFDSALRRSPSWYRSGSWDGTCSTTHGPTTLTLRRSRTICTSTRRQILPDLSLPLFSMVRPRHLPQVHTSVLIHCVRFAFPGFLVVLFFKCMAALLNPVDHRGEPIKWGLVSYTVVMFSVATVQTAVNLQIQSISYIDNREFPGIVGEISPGPIGYQVFMGHEALTTLSNVMFFLNAWLADGFLVSSLLYAALTRPGT